MMFAWCVKASSEASAHVCSLVRGCSFEVVGNFMCGRVGVGVCVCVCVCRRSGKSSLTEARMPGTTGNVGNAGCPFTMTWVCRA